MKPRRCRDCCFFGLPEGERAYEARRYPCKWEFSPQPLPDSITRAYGFQAVPSRALVGPNNGVACPTFVRAPGR
jgi:hypothetical protein